MGGRLNDDAILRSYPAFVALAAGAAATSADADVPASWAVYDAGQHRVAFWRLAGDEVEGWEPAP